MIEIGKQYPVTLTTNDFLATVVRKLVPGVDDLDPEVGDMYEVTIHVYADEIAAL